jgi:hypothetical protein
MLNINEAGEAGRWLVGVAIVHIFQQEALALNNLSVESCGSPGCCSGTCCPGVLGAHLYAVKNKKD